MSSTLPSKTTATTTNNASSKNNNNQTNKRVLSVSTTSTTPTINIEQNNRSKKLPSLLISRSERSTDDEDQPQDNFYYSSNNKNNTNNHQNHQRNNDVVHPFNNNHHSKKNNNRNERVFTSVVPSSPSSPLALPNTTQGKKMHAFENDFNKRQQQQQRDGSVSVGDDDSSQKSLIPVQLLGLRSKTMTALIITFLLIIALCVIGLSISFDSSFRSVEEREATDSILKLSKALQDDYTILANRLYEYAAWDDVYNVLQEESATKAQDLLKSFFACEYMDRVNLNFAMYYLPNGSFLTGLGCYNQVELSVFPTELTNLDLSFFSQVYTPTTRMRTYMIPTMTVEDLLEQSGQTRPSTSSSTNILMVTVQPTQTTDNTVSNGLAIFASYITMKLLEEESKRVRLCATFYNVNNTEDRKYLEKYFSPTSGQTLDQYISLQASSMVSPNDTWTFNGPFKMLAGSVKDTSKRKCVSDDDGGKRISSFKILSDSNGVGRVVMRTDLPRDIYNLGWYSFLYTIIAFLVLIIILTFSILLFVEFVVLRRVIKIGSFVRNVTTESDTSKRIQKMGRDELGNLSRDINKMLEALEFSQEKLARDNSLMEKILERTALEEEKSRCLLNSITDFIATVECSTGLIVSINSSFENKVLKKKQVTSDDNKEVFDIFEYLKEFSDNKQLLEKLDKLSHTEENFDTMVTTGLGSKYPVSINVNKTKMTLREGQVGEAFIVVMKNLSEQKDFRNLVQQEKLSQIQQITKFEKMMNDQDMRKRFRAFAEKEQSVENFLFLEDIEVYKSLPTTKERAILQEAITKKYLQNDSEFPLNVSQKVLETEYKKISIGYGQLSLFDRLETIVKGMILGDTFQRFIDHEQNELNK